MANMEEGAYNFVILARQLTAYCNYKNAFEMYLCSYDKHPEMKKLYEAEFYEVLTRLNDNLAAAGHKADIFANFERAIKVFPDSVKLLNDIGSLFFEYGNYPEALCHFEKAFIINNCSVSTEKNLNVAKSWVFPRYNFRGLNDKIRNEAYRRAIQSSVTDAASVVHIHAGTGLLALYATARRPIETTACDVPNHMAKLTERIMQDNNARVAVTNEPSMVINRIHDSRFVLLTDSFDAGLFGHGILKTLCHVWEIPLHSGSKVIPGSAEYFIVGVKCDELVKKHKLCAAAKNMLNVPNMNVHNATGECYCGEDVHLYEDLKYMTEAKSLFKINFEDYDDVFAKLHKREPYTATLRAADDGEVDVVIGYFDAHLTKDITITSNPRSECRVDAWQTAVFFDFVPREVKKNDAIDIPFTTYRGNLSIVPEPDVQITRISVQALKFLNDTEYMKMIAECLGTVCIYLGQITDLSYVDIADLSPFPVFGLLMMMRGANSLVCQATVPEDQAFLQAVLRANKIPDDKVITLVGTLWSDEVYKNKKFHIIFKDILHFTGDVDIPKKQISEILVNAHLVDNGLTLPIQVSLIGQLVHSEWLENNNRVTDENLHGYKMAAHVNRYQLSQVLCLDLSRLEYTPISEEFVIAKSCEDMKSGVITVPVATDGVINALLCWYEIQLMEDRGCTSTKRGSSCVMGMAFLDACQRVFVGDDVNVLLCMDPDGSFKCVIDVEP